ncbi:protein of unknown function [Taphrina deformans PYCC 5710]|uniref:Protein fyv10 n=1 Tax=Taphrina deformans (strain PYCC 5710 / ATCC 11124 / CBS 356.35 / IMI 108563 / JCM 9778 / NBRC 8474) TaxID=1097556 RepID=R4XM61_TAPDE|nr:protein of unknown function [Taphrina deformans PYCC 5710]|eukprot:CCG84385.1 protein of unknown function [Taphrina deformans PYCC 5710]
MKLPQELIKTNLKNQQKVIEKEITWSANALSSTELSSAPNLLAQQLDLALARFKAMKRKVEGLREEERQHLSRSRARLEHMHDLIERSVDLKDRQNVDIMRLHRLVVEYMLRQGFSSTARTLALHYRIDNLLDIDVFIQSKSIADALRRQNTQPCLAWCSEHKSALRKSKNALEFDIRKQEFIELIRKNLLEQAIQYAQKNLASHRELRQPEVDQVCALLCYKSDTQVQPYKNLYSQERWEFLADSFLQTHHSMCNIPSKSPLEVALSAGLSALKTTSCYACDQPRSKNTRNLTSTCPICSPELNELASEVPYSHAVRTHLVDPLTGGPMEESNEPVVIPNGHVYGSQSLRNWSIKNSVRDQMVEDPESGQVFPISAIRRAFVL